MTVKVRAEDGLNFLSEHYQTAICDGPAKGDMLNSLGSLSRKSPCMVEICVQAPPGRKAQRILVAITHLSQHGGVDAEGWLFTGWAETLCDRLFREVEGFVIPKSTQRRSATGWIKLLPLY